MLSTLGGVFRERVPVHPSRICSASIMNLPAKVVRTVLTYDAGMVTSLIRLLQELWLVVF